MARKSCPTTLRGQPVFAEFAKKTARSPELSDSSLSGVTEEEEDEDEDEDEDSDGDDSEAELQRRLLPRISASSSALQPSPRSNRSRLLQSEESLRQEQQQSKTSATLISSSSSPSAPRFGESSPIDQRAASSTTTTPPLPPPRSTSSTSFKPIPSATFNPRSVTPLAGSSKDLIPSEGEAKQRPKKPSRVPPSRLSEMVEEDFDSDSDSDSNSSESEGDSQAEDALEDDDERFLPTSVRSSTRDSLRLRSSNSLEPLLEFVRVGSSERMLRKRSSDGTVKTEKPKPRISESKYRARRTPSLLAKDMEPEKSWTQLLKIDAGEKVDVPPDWQ